MEIQAIEGMLLGSISSVPVNPQQFEQHLQLATAPVMPPLSEEVVLEVAEDTEKAELGETDEIVLEVEEELKEETNEDVTQPENWLNLALMTSEPIEKSQLPLKQGEVKLEEPLAGAQEKAPLDEQDKPIRLGPTLAVEKGDVAAVGELVEKKVEHVNKTMSSETQLNHLQESASEETLTDVRKVTDLEGLPRRVDTKSMEKGIELSSQGAAHEPESKPAVSGELTRTEIATDLKALPESEELVFSSNKPGKEAIVLEASQSSVDFGPIPGQVVETSSPARTVVTQATGVDERVSVRPEAVREFQQQNMTKISELLSQPNLKKGSEMLKLTLQPEKLGQLEIMVKLEEGKISAKFLVGNEAVKELVEKSLPLLEQNLVKQQITVGKVDVALQNNSQGGFDFSGFDQKRQRGKPLRTASNYQGQKQVDVVTTEKADRVDILV